ncbi:MAG: ankyrin repeat domain-containing protein [Puniceicoccales bacterium]|jgi:hypothetical protein|nr:ankyrin repeat domain-containing protein [Puniceicoccales bacterium]
MEKYKIGSLLVGTFLMLVVSYGSVVAKQLKPQSAANETISYKGFFSAIEKGDVEKVNRYLNRGADVNARMEEIEHDSGGSFIHYLSPLIVAIRSGKIDMVRLLLQRGANVNTEGGNVNVPIYEAVNYSRGQLDIIRLLLEQKGIDVNVPQNTRMSYDQVDDLGLRGEPYNYQIPETALQRAGGQTQIVQLLKAHGTKY